MIELSSAFINSTHSEKPVVEYNNFFNNELNIRLSPGIYGIEAYRNYWGTTDCSKISSKINSRQAAAYEPFLDAPYQAGREAYCKDYKKTDFEDLIEIPKQGQQYTEEYETQ